jgi:putative Holliday junction resolvase
MSGPSRPPGRILGLDPGERRIGVAISDPLGIIAQPHSVIDREREDALEAVRNLVTRYDVARVVVGHPVSLSGREGAAAAAARSFAAELADAVDCDVVLADERLTTAIAERALLEGGVRRERRREVRDKVAAAVMLQAYIDREQVER